MNNTDYKKPQIHVVDELPEVLQTEANRSLFETTVDRQLSKTDLTNTVGVIGVRNPNAFLDRQIKEPSIFDQAYQLQPLIHETVATVEHLSSYQDILRELQALGVDLNRIPKWGNTEQFNYAPPINFDKLINFSDYLWVGPNGSTPQYVTIENPCNLATAKLKQKQRDLNGFGTARTIFAIDSANSKFTILEDLTDFFSAGTTFDVVDSASNNGLYTVTESVFELGRTVITVAEAIPNGSVVDGSISFATTLQNLQNDESLLCTGGLGWDVEPWDDTSVNAHWDNEGAYVFDGNPWSDSNFWVHRLNVDPDQQNTAQSAQGPIIEYASTIQLNQWTETKYNWMRRETVNDPWVATTDHPTFAQIDSNVPGEEFLDLWTLISVDDPIPVGVQPVNPSVVTVTTDAPVGSQTLIRTTSTQYDIDAAFHAEAIAGENNIRVFVNSVQVYGTYQEIESATGFVVGVNFFEAIPASSRVEIQLSAQALADVGYERRSPVRHILDDDEWALYVANNSPLELASLIRYRIAIQTKSRDEVKAPLFDLYNIDGTSANIASPIFTYAESSDSAIVDFLQLRARRQDGAYVFDQHLIDMDNGPTLAYVDSSSVDAQTNPQGLQTIWRKANEDFVPQLVDEDRNYNGDEIRNDAGDTVPAVVNSTNGVYEFAAQLMFNANHENRKYVTYTQLVSHMNTALDGQVLPTGFTNERAEAKLLLSSSEFDYGKGGTIKEFNDSYDTLISTIFVNNVNPIQLIDFAKTEYDQALNFVKELYNGNVFNLLNSSDDAALTDVVQFIADSIIREYELNDSYSVAYGDSNTFNATDNTGVRNWIATLPFINALVKSAPLSIIDEERGLSSIRHHDGHESVVSITASSANNLKTLLVNTESSVAGRKKGWTNAAPADGGTQATRLTVTPSRLLKGDYWLEETGEFYRLNVVHVGPLPPLNTSDIAEGAFWIRDSDNMLMRRETSNVTGWVEHTGISGNIEAAWYEIDFTELLANVLVNIETRLYDAAPANPTLVFPRSEYVLDAADETEYNRLMEREFLDFTKQQKIVDPLATDYKATDAFTWNYIDVANGDVTSPTAAAVSTFWAARWDVIYQNVYNTPYVHIEPWKLQNYTQKPEWWDGEYKDVTGTRRWNATMWSNILAGTIPAAYSATAPATVPTYTFVPVNTTSATTSDGYGPDDLLPPFWNPPTANANDTAVAGSAFIQVPLSSLTGVNFAKAYVFGEDGPVERRWKKSTDYRYSELKTAFRMQPVRYTHHMLGLEFTNVGELQIENTSKKVYSHVDAIFHGDLNEENNTIYSFDGLLQWYVNFNRENSYDSRNPDFRPLWTGWIPRMGYQFRSLIDDDSLTINTNTFEVDEAEREVLVKRSPGYRDLWIDGLTVTVGNFGRATQYNGYKVPFGIGTDWTFVIDAPSPILRTINYYTARNYEFTFADKTTGLMESTQDLPWSTGDAVTLSTSGTLPGALNPTSTFYYVQGPNPNQFYLADTQQDAQAVPAVVFVDFNNQYDDGTHFITELTTTFTALGGERTNASWRHHVLNDSTVETVLPITIKGIQGVIDFVDGYSKYLSEQGFVFNRPEVLEYDDTTGRTIDWQFKTEQFIETVYTGLGINNQQGQFQGKTYEYTSDILTDALTVPNLPVPFDDGQEVFLFTTGMIPEPLQLNTPYYIIKLTDTTFKLASTRSDALQNIAIDITGTTTGAQFIGAFDSPDIFASSRFALNPFQNNLWFETNEGVVSDMIDGPYVDIRTDQTIFDQDGDRFNNNELQVWRQDRLTHFGIRENQQLRVDPISGDIINRYIGGMHLFLDSYEHVVLFDNYTTDNILLYDPFIGLSVPRYLLDYKEQTSDARRPAIGGYVLNEDGSFERNVEGTIEDMELYYDAFKSDERALYAKQARKTLGFNDPTYLDEISATDKTKFLFWKGLIQAKGSIRAVNAFINSVQFVDARVDEYWAYKVAEFGDYRERQYPGVKMLVNDVRRDDVKYQFSTSTTEDGFDQISIQDDARWVDFPDVVGAYGTDFKFDEEAFKLERYRVVDNAGTFNIEQYDDVNAKWVAAIHFDAGSVNHLQLAMPVDRIVSIVTSGSITQTAITMLSPVLVEVPKVVGEFELYSMGVAKSAYTPSKVIDTSTDVTIVDIPTWDPARGYHNHTAESIIDYVENYDPAHNSGNETRLWTDNAIGTVWLDVSNAYYLPYHDRRIYATDVEQIAAWGKLADDADVVLYQWVKSSVAPSEYAGRVSAEETDTSIPANIRASGVPKKTIMKKNGAVYERISPRSVELVIDAYHGLSSSPDISAVPTTAEYIMLLNGEAFDDNTFTQDQLVNTYSSNISNAYQSRTGNTLTATDHLQLKRKFTSTELEDDYREDYDFIQRGDDYFFWVSDRSVRHDQQEVSVKDANIVLRVPNISYQIFRKSNTSNNYYDQLIIRNLKNVVQLDDRYKLQMNRDFTQRDVLRRLNATTGNNDLLNNVHTEWETFRRAQPNHIPLTLWNKLTEAVVGFRLDTLDSGTMIPIPSVDRVLYDQKFNETTRFGLGDSQAVVHKTTAIATILATINRSDFNTYPEDKFNFLQETSFDAPQNIRTAMQRIFDKFPSERVNEIFFETLLDIMAVKRDYADIFKTSWISIHGVKLLETAGNVNEI